MRSRNWSRVRGRTLAVVLAAASGVLAAPGVASAIPPLEEDPFYAYAGATPLADVAPGTVLNTRTVTYRASGLALPLKALQILHRSTGQLGQPTVNATTVLRPIVRTATPKLVAYGSFYDSLNPSDQPSYAIAGGRSLGGLIASAETALIVPMLQRGYTVTISDTEGQDANFAAGPEYGMNTLDAIRATFNTPAAGVPAATQVGLFGYSGGAIATEWAAELAPTYAPDVATKLIGAAMGGVLVRPATNLRYVDGSLLWAGVMPMAIIGVSRAFDVDLTPYLSAYGQRVYTRMQNASIIQVIGAYPGLTWKKLAKPEYADPEDVPIYVNIVNQLIMGTGGTPTTPLLIGQGAKGEIEGTKGNKPGIGRGDGVMVAGDVRALARQYCDQGVTVQYRQYNGDGHTSAALKWIPAAFAWLGQRFAGAPAPENCAEIAPGNSLAPIGE